MQPSSAPSGDSQIKSSIEAKPKELPAVMEYILSAASCVTVLFLLFCGSN